MKKIIASIMSIAMAATIVAAPFEDNFTEGLNNIRTSISAKAYDYPIESNDRLYYYNNLKDGTVKFAGFYDYNTKNTITNFTVPSTIDGKKVTVIGSNALSFCSSLKSVKIPSTITTIEDSAFYNCKKLTNISFPNGLKTIGEYAFWYCTSLKTVSIPSTVKTIKDKAFLDCTSLTKISIPNSVTSLGERAFNNCKNLKTAIIGNGVTTLKGYTFYDCTSLTSIKLGNGITKIEFNACSDCPKLNSVTLGNKVKTIEDWAFHNCPKLKSVTIPKSVKKIGFQAFGHYINSKNKYVKVSNFKIKCYGGSPAIKYAKDNKFSYSLLGVSKPAKVSLKVTAGKKKATLKWNKAKGATSYNVYYKASKNGKWKKLKSLSYKTRQYSKTKLKSKKIYYFRVDSVKSYYGKYFTTTGSTKSVKIK